MSTTSGNNSKSNLLIAAVAVIVILLGINAYMIYNRSQLKAENTELSADLDETTKLKEELNKQYYSALSELEGMRGTNEELNALIDQQKQELDASKSKIEGLLRDKGNLSKARSEIANLQGRINQLLAEVNQLRGENETLKGDVTRLGEEKTQLQTSLEAEKTTTAQLSTEKSSLETEKADLEKTKSELSKKVTAASAIKVQEIEGTGLITKDQKKPSKSNNAKKVNQVDVCFEIIPNDNAEIGQEVFHVRVIAPNGETLASEGSFTNGSGDDVPFSKAKSTSYNKGVSKVCASVAPGAPFAEGDYKVEVYNKGYLSGKGTFRLK
jgi:predicted  nucleic acid-binding Zn-ribbon protein